MTVQKMLNDLHSSKTEFQEKTSTCAESTSLHCGKESKDSEKTVAWNSGHDINWTGFHRLSQFKMKREDDGERRFEFTVDKLTRVAKVCSPRVQLVAMEKIR